MQLVTLPDLGRALVDNTWLRLVFAGSLLLLPIAVAALLLDAGWLLLVTLVLSASVDGVLRAAPVGRARILHLIRDRSAQLSTVRVALVAVALLTITDTVVAAVVLAAGLAVSVLCRVAAGLAEVLAVRAGWDWSALGQAGVGAQYIRSLAASELVVFGAFAMALLGAPDGWTAAVAALAWLPSVWLALIAGWRWRRAVRLPPPGPPKAPPGRVAVYFAEPESRAYQLEQWLPVLEDLHRDLGVSLIFRQRASFELFGTLTTLPRVHAETLDDVMSVYASGDHGVLLYVNNGMRNFQSLAWPRALHVHINHGESDKTSLVTHQARAYDRILVAGEAAVARMRAGLLEVDTSGVEIVGRPQLDYVDVAAEAGRTERPVLVYAPTWEGESNANNFSSVDIGGPAIVRELLDVPGATVLYKPHPRTPGSSRREMRAAHARICELLSAAARRDPAAGHGQWEGDILPLLARADLLVADVSSVTVDHLYLRPDARLVLMDRARDGGHVRAAEIPIASSAEVVRADQVDGLAATVARLLGSDEQAAARAEVRQQYFGVYEVGESARRFRSLVAELVSQRDAAIGTGRVSATVSVEQSDSDSPSEPLSG